MTQSVPEAVAEFIAAGWKVCRIQPGSKGPRDSDWNEPGHEIISPELFPLGWGVGLLHAWSGTMALDIDNYPVAATWLAERGVDLDALMEADDAVRISSGKVDSAKLLYACPARPGAACAPYPSKDRNDKPRTAMALDFRCATASGNSQQDALPPTIHPKRGVAYVWEFGMCGDWRALPPLPPALEAIWTELKAPVANAAPAVAAPSGAAPARIQAWLNTQDPGMCRNDWVKVGAKLHAEFQGSQDGFNIWCAWSARNDKWAIADENGQSGSVEAYPVWKSFRLEGRPLATLDAEVRSLPAEPDEFEVVPVEHKSEQPEPAAPGELPEVASERETREVMQNWVVYQTGVQKQPYFLRPGHPNAKIRTAAGLAGVEISERQLGNIFAPYLPPVVVNKRVLPQDPVYVVRQAKWRREVHRMAFNPGGDEIYVSPDGHEYLNGYRKIPVEPIKPLPRQIEPLLWLLRRVLDDRGEQTGGDFAIWLVRLYAFVMQNPGIKVRWAPLLYSAKHGTGKTTLLETLPALLYGRQYVRPMVHSVLKERFAAARFDATWWVTLAEMHSDAGKLDAKAIANKLKQWITDDELPIEKKGVDVQFIRNKLQFTATSNYEDALFIEDGSEDRRWLIGEMCDMPLSVAEMTMLNPLFGDDHKRDPLAQSWIHWYFLNRDVSDFNPSEPPPRTIAKTRMQEQSRSLWEDAIYTAMRNFAPPFDKELVQPEDISQTLLVGKGVTIGQARMLLTKAGAKRLKRLDHGGTIFSMRNHGEWNATAPADIRGYLRGGPKPFTVDDGSDLL